MKHFHHIFMPGGDMSGGWRFLLADQMDLFENSGLVDACGGVLIGVIGTTKDRAELRERLAVNYPYATIIHEVNHDADDNHNDEWYEGATLKMLWDYCKNRHSGVVPVEREPIIYTHSKGAVTVNKCVHQWRRMMEYFIVENWPHCEGLIQSGEDVVGCDWKYNGWWHFSGNFWCAASDHIAKLPDPTMKCEGVPGAYYVDDTRVKYEMWIGSGVKLGLKPNICEVHHSTADNHYLEPYPASKYRK